MVQYISSNIINCYLKMVEIEYSKAIDRLRIGVVGNSYPKDQFLVDCWIEKQEGRFPEEYICWPLGDNRLREPIAVPTFSEYLNRLMPGETLEIN